MQTYFSTPAGSRNPASSWLIVAGGAQRLQLDWATYEGSGSAERQNEDSLLVATSGDTLLLAVFDGVTPIPGAALPNGGHVAAASAANGVRAAFLAGERDPVTLLLRGNAAVAQASHTHGIAPGDPLQNIATTAVVAVLDLIADTLVYAAISDSSLLLKPYGGPAARLNANLVRSAKDNLIRPAAAELRPSPAIDDAFWQRVLTSRRGQNAASGRGSGVLNGMPDALVRPYIDSAPAPLALATVERCVLLTDGAELNQIGATDTWTRLDADLFRLGSLAYLEHVRELEDQDPDRAHYTRMKPHDDATIIAVSRLTN